MTTIINRARRLLPFIAFLLAAAVALPPVGTYARRYAVVQAVQFVIFAVVVPALLAIGWPSWPLALRVGRSGPPGKPIGRPVLRATVIMLPFMALAVIWRLPTVLNGLDRDPALTAAELVTLTTAGTAVWLELTGATRQPLPRPLRAAMAAFAMWTIWIVAYLAGMSGWAAGSASAGNLNAAADRQLAVAVMWAVPAICFVPVVYATMMRWLSDRDRQEPEAARATAPDDLHSFIANAPRPPRGWRTGSPG